MSREFYVPGCTPYAYPIKAVSNHLKRLIKLKNKVGVNSNGGSVEENTEEEVSNLSSSDETISSGDTFDPLQNSFNLTSDIPSTSENFSSSSNPIDVSNRSGNLYNYYPTGLPSTSSTYRPLINDIPESSEMTIATIFSPMALNAPIMVSHSVNTSTYGMSDVTLANASNQEGVIITDNSSQFTAAVQMHVGSEDDDQRFYIEPRRIPFIVQNPIIRNDNIGTVSFFDFTSSSSYSTSSSESESSSESGLFGEFGGSSALLRRRRNEIRELYDVAMRRTVMKPFLFSDDEPPIH